MLTMFKKKCVLCKARDKAKNMKYVEFFDWDYVDKHYFHSECLRNIICNPGTYKTATVDKAIWIHKKLREVKREKEAKQKERNADIEIAQDTLECV